MPGEAVTPLFSCAVYAQNPGTARFDAHDYGFLELESNMVMEQEWSRMRGNSGEPYQDLEAAVVEGRDSQQITELIKQLDRDLEETQKKVRKPR
jgi:hypothetical protein